MYTIIPFQNTTASQNLPVSGFFGMQIHHLAPWLSDFSWCNTYVYQNLENRIPNGQKFTYISIKQSNWPQSIPNTGHKSNQNFPFQRSKIHQNWGVGTYENMPSGNPVWHISSLLSNKHFASLYVWITVNGIKRIDFCR
jgi:hypothetical protein